MEIDLAWLNTYIIIKLAWMLIVWILIGIAYIVLMISNRKGKK